jgi:hypothetical protein
MYMTPSRRAIAADRPRLSLPSSQPSNAWAWARSARSAADTRQSNARPSLCSLVPPMAQFRPMPLLRVVG